MQRNFSEAATASSLAADRVWPWCPRDIEKLLDGTRDAAAAQEDVDVERAFEPLASCHDSRASNWPRLEVCAGRIWNCKGDRAFAKPILIDSKAPCCCCNRSNAAALTHLPTDYPVCISSRQGKGVQFSSGTSRQFVFRLFPLLPAPDTFLSPSRALPCPPERLPMPSHRAVGILMGDLKARLRAKFPRRTSGISLLVPDKSSAPSTSGSETQSRRLSDAPAAGVGAAGVANGRWKADGGGSSGGDGPSADEKHSHRRQALAAPPTPGEAFEARDGLRQKEAAAKQESSPAAQKPTTDVRATSIDTGNDDAANTDTDNNDGDDVDSDKALLHQSETQRAAVASAVTTPHSDGTPQNAANAIQSGTMHSAATLSGHTADCDGPDVNGNDQHALIAKLSRINEDSSPDIATGTTRPTVPAADTASSADAVVLNDPSPTSAVPADSLRRIKLTDPPVNFPPSPATAAANLSHSNSLNLRPSSSIHRPTVPTRRQSLLPSRQTTLIRTLLSVAQADDLDSAGADLLLPISANMVTRKIWVKRPGASATLVTINEEDLVDDVREMILRKYANSLGRHFDAPDLNLRIIPREQRQERSLGPDEPMARTLDAYFPGGQTVEEALVIDIPPPRRTPRASPRAGPPHAQHLTAYFDESRPAEAGTDYFGPEAIANPSPAVPGTVTNGTAHPHTISVLNTGQVPQIPSPGGTRTRPYRDRPDRPRLGRQHTSSPTILNVVSAGSHSGAIAGNANHGTQRTCAKVSRSVAHSNDAIDQPTTGPPPPAPPLPTPPVQDIAPAQIPRTATPPPRAASPRPPVPRPKKKKTIVDQPTLPAVMLNGGVPPINVLIVEDNIINLRLLEAFVKRLKVRWQTAMNGREAVDKWRAGGFHLVLMDIQLPVMSGLEATREIRRLERMNSIGAFSSSPPPPLGASSGKANVKGKNEGELASSPAGESSETATEEDKLDNRELFKSPVIIVALTASSLQSDRHEALAAGCNDFLTKVWPGSLRSSHVICIC